MEIKSENPYKLYYKYDMASNDYYVLSVKKNTRRQCSIDTGSVERLYQSNLPIPKPKKDDLINMCNSGIIPSSYHDFFTNIASVNTVIVILILISLSLGTLEFYTKMRLLIIIIFYSILFYSILCIFCAI